VLRCKLPKSEDLVTLADWLDAAAVDEEKQELGLSVPDILYGLKTYFKHF
jgi:hypothetical protein